MIIIQRKLKKIFIYIKKKITNENLFLKKIKI